MRLPIRAARLALGLTAALLIGLAPAQGKTLRMANQGDPLSLDPHSLNETLQLTILSNVYEGLVGYGKDLNTIITLTSGQ